MWPPLRQRVKEPDTFGEASPRLLPKTWVINEAMLEMNSCYYKDAMGKCWVADFEPFVLD